MRLPISLLAILSAASLAACGSPVDSNEAGSTSGDAGGSKASTGTSHAGGSDTGGGDTGGGKETGGGGSVDVAYPAPHPGEPQIPDHGGVTLHDPVIVTVTWPSDSMESYVEAFGDTVGSFMWWPTWANDYGVGPATGGGHVPLSEAAPTTISDDEIQSWLDASIQDGTMPAPTDQTIYALYYPSSTTVTIPQSEGGGSSCAQFLGYHNSFTTTFMGASVPVAYAVINRCGDQDSVTETASHEFAEAATDPHPLTGGLAYMITADSPWTVAGGEVSDMCSEVGGVTEQGYSLTRVWSNSAAAKGDQPCVPNPDPTTPFFDAGLVHDTLSASPGQTVTTKVDCYSFGPLPSAIELVAQPYSPETLTITFDKPTCKNGDVVTMSVAVAANATAATDYHFDVIAQLNPMTGHVWRGMIHVAALP